MKYLALNLRLIMTMVLVVGLMIWLSPDISAAGLGQAPGGVPGASLSSGNTPEGAVIAFAVLLQRVADGAAALASGVAILFIVINGARLTFSFGNTESMGKAKKGFIWAAAGLVLIIFAYIVTKSVIALTYSGADGSSVIGTAMIEAPGSAILTPVPGGPNPDGLCRDIGVLPAPCFDNNVPGLTVLPVLVTKQVSVDGVSREYSEYVPGRLVGGTDVMSVLIVLHGAGGSGTGIGNKTGFDALAESRGFMTVYPESLDLASGAKKWDIAGTTNNDIGFMNAMIAKLGADYGSRLGDIYVAGMSNGSVFAQAMGCQISEISGVASASGALTAGALASCNRPSSLPFIGFYGTDDQFNEQDKFNNAFSFFASEINNCSAVLESDQFSDTDLTDGTQVNLIVPQGGCGVQMEYYEVINGGHFWADGNYSSSVQSSRQGNLTHDINASNLIANFFALGALSPEPENDAAACSEAAALALTGVCSDLGASPCTIPNLHEAIDYSLLNVVGDCAEDGDFYGRCTSRALEELYRTECIQ